MLFQVNEGKSTFNKWYTPDCATYIERIAIITMVGLTALYCTHQVSLSVYACSGFSAFGIYLVNMAVSEYIKRKIEDEELQGLGFIQDLDFKVRMARLCPEIDFNYN